jgi:L-2-hydroxyglutarate oxidase LhgO
MPPNTTTTTSSSSSPIPHQHGVHGVYYGGDWLDMEDCDHLFSLNPSSSSSSCSTCDHQDACPRSKSRNSSSSNDINNTKVYDVLIIGAGCIGSAIARELSRYQQLSVLLVDAADDVSQGATKGNSGIVHAGYDDTPNTNRSKYCWKGNQMFAQLDRELRFGYQKNGSLVIATNDKEIKVLEELMKRGATNGVERLRIVQQAELREMEPHVHPSAVAALYAPDAGNVIPYEFAIALAENAVDNGVELRIRRQVTQIVDTNAHDKNKKKKEGGFTVQLDHWEPADYVESMQRLALLNKIPSTIVLFLQAIGLVVFVHYVGCRLNLLTSPFGDVKMHVIVMLTLFVATRLVLLLLGPASSADANKKTVLPPIPQLVQQAGAPEGGKQTSKKGGSQHVEVEDMFVGGSGSGNVMHGKVVEREAIQCRYIVNCAGGASDQVAALIGDRSFKIKPRVGDYILLNRNQVRETDESSTVMLYCAVTALSLTSYRTCPCFLQGHLARHTLFPCPDPVLGKGVLVQTTLWGNLILGPTARDMYKPEARNMSSAEIQEYILSKCKALVPSFDTKETIHAFAGARAKSDRGDWIIEPSKMNSSFIHVAGIDSPGLAGSPAIAIDVVELLKAAGLQMKLDPNFNPNRAPIITPKAGMKGLKMGPVGKNDSDGINIKQMEQNVICKCEKVTEMEVVRALRRSLPIDSSQGIRKRTRAGMGHCQGDPDNYNCEARVRAIIARENKVPIEQCGKRPWPATSTLSERWIDDNEKKELESRMQKD